ncbi:MAG: hypothetical protein H6Q15_1940 [Bacteroidetes bacterium]|nr:hypothetical protein [Bacteroidota bacterium]
MKKLFTFFATLFLSASAFSAIVIGTVGNGNFVNWQGTSSQGYGLDFNKDGVLEFKLSNTGFDVENINCYIEYNITNQVNNIWASGTNEDGWDLPKNLTANTQIGSSGNWIGAGDCSLISWTDETPVFTVGTTAYMGFRFKIGSNTHYGWAKVVVSGNSTTGYTATFQQIAYESTPNTPIKVAQTLGMNSVETISLSVYPNPASNTINILGGDRLSKISISNFVGEKIIEINKPVNTINIESLKPGIYFITLYDGKISTTKKLIKK